MSRAPMTEVVVVEEPIHVFFELSYANYLVLPRSLLQSMPVEWQRDFVARLNEMHEHFGDGAMAPGYRVRAVDLDGKFIVDPAPHYDRGRAHVPGRLREMGHEHE